MPSPLSFSILSLFFHIFFIHLISLPSSFRISPRTFLSLLSFRYIHSICAQLSLSPYSSILHLLSSNSIQYLFSLSAFPRLNLAIIFLSFALSLPRYFGISSVIHLSYFVLYLESFILSLLSYFSVFLSLSLNSTFILLLSVSPVLHWHIRFSGSMSFSLSSPCFFSFPSSILFVSCTISFHPFYPQTFPLSFPILLSAYSSCTLPSQCKFLYLFFFLPSPDLCPVHSLSCSQTLSFSS
jgi:hypothetical protein